MYYIDKKGCGEETAVSSNIAKTYVRIFVGAGEQTMSQIGRGARIQPGCKHLIKKSKKYIDRSIVKKYTHR